MSVGSIDWNGGITAALRSGDSATIGDLLKTNIKDVRISCGPWLEAKLDRMCFTRGLIIGAVTISLEMGVQVHIWLIERGDTQSGYREHERGHSMGDANQRGLIG